MAAAYVKLIRQTFNNTERTAGRNALQRESWKSRLRDYHNTYDPTTKTTNMVCYGAQSSRAIPPNASQPISYRISLAIEVPATYLASPPTGMGVIWSMKNGLVMNQNLERQYDGELSSWSRFRTRSNEPRRQKFVLMGPKLGLQKISGNIFPLTWKDLDRRELQFRFDQRLGSPYLYYHYVTTLLGYVRFEKPGWAEKRLQLPTGKKWATPGPYLRKSTFLRESRRPSRPKERWQRRHLYTGNGQEWRDRWARSNGKNREKVESPERYEERDGEKVEEEKEDEDEEEEENTDEALGDS